MEEKRKAFLARGMMQVDEFGHDGLRYVLYKINVNNPTTYITGDRFDWEFGLQYEKEIRMIAKFYQVEDDVKKIIENVLKANRT